MIVDLFFPLCDLVADNHRPDKVQAIIIVLTSLKDELNALDPESSKPAEVAHGLVTVLDSRTANVKLSEELLLRTRENLRASIQLESIRLSSLGLPS